MRPVRIRRAADADMDEIFAWIARDDPAAADRTIDRIVAAAQRLADFPESGRIRPEIGPRVRSLPVGRYILLYKVEPDHVDVVRIVHGSRRFESLVDEPEDD